MFMCVFACVYACVCACERMLCCIHALHASAHLRASVWNSSTHIPLTIKVKLILCTAAYPSTSVATHICQQQSGKATATKLKLILKGQWSLPWKTLKENQYKVRGLKRLVVFDTWSVRRVVFFAQGGLWGGWSFLKVSLLLSLKSQASLGIIGSGGGGLCCGLGAT